MLRAAIALATFGAAAGTVVQLTASNFDEAVAADGIVFVQFYAPWCAHCKKLSPEWEKAATQLDGRATFAKCDATAEVGIAEKFDLQGYPTIMYWESGHGPVEYTDGRTAQDLVAFAEALKGPPVLDIADSAALTAAKERHDVLVVLFSAADSAELTSFTSVVAPHRTSHTFAHVSSTELSAQESVTPPAVVVYRSFDEKVQCPHEPKVWSEKLLPFVRNNSFRLLDEVGPANYERYLQRQAPIAWLFVDPTDEATSTRVKEAVTTAARDLSGEVSFVWISGTAYGQMAGRVGVSTRSWPALGAEWNRQRFGFDGDINAAAVSAWGRKLVDGTLEPTVRSEAKPSVATSEGLTTLVGSTFKDIVLDTEKDVLVQFHAPWCGHCKAMAPAYAAVARRYEQTPGVVIAQMDATANDAPADFPIRGYPTLALVKRESNAIELYDSAVPRDEESITEFVERHLQQQRAQPTSSNHATEL